jgi:hypothetical protein
LEVAESDFYYDFLMNSTDFSEHNAGFLVNSVGFFRNQTSHRVSVIFRKTGHISEVEDGMGERKVDNAASVGVGVPLDEGSFPCASPKMRNGPPDPLEISLIV